MPKTPETEIDAHEIKRVRKAATVEGFQEKILTDPVCRGLQIRVRPGGAAIYRLRYVSGGKHKAFKLGDVKTGSAIELEKMRKAAFNLRDKMREQPGYDPIVERDEQARAAELERQRAEREALGTDTVSKIVSNYIQREAKKNLRTWGESERIFNFYVTPTWGTRRIHSIARSEVAELLDKIEDAKFIGADGEPHGGPVMADRVLAAVRRLFNWHASRDDTFNSPIVKGMARTKPRERMRQRALTNEEVKMVWNACDVAEPPIFGTMVKMLLLTAQRRDEVRTMRWADIKGDTWVIPVEHYKSKRAQAVPLSKAAQAILSELRKTRTKDAEFVFTMGNSTSRPGKGEKGARPFGNVTEAKAALDEKSGVTGWVLHDLRRTARSLMTAAGVRPDICERVLGHVVAGIAGNYDVYEYIEEKRHAVEALASRVETLLRRKGKNVLEFAPVAVAAS